MALQFGTLFKPCFRNAPNIGKKLHIVVWQHNSIICVARMPENYDPCCSNTLLLLVMETLLSASC